MSEIDGNSLAHKRSVENGNDDLRQLKPSTADDIVRRGQEALQRLRRSYDDWMDVAEALDVGRTQVMRELHTNKPVGRRYAKEMGEWLRARGFHLINEGTRNRLLECLQHKTEIEKWRARLTDAERFRFNHPDTILRKWKAASAVPNPNTLPKTSAYAKLKEANIELQERLHRAKCELARGGGDLWTPDDIPQDIAKVMLERLSAHKAEKVARIILAKLKADTKARRPVILAAQAAE